jgi:hypothetical protein
MCRRSVSSTPISVVTQFRSLFLPIGLLQNLRELNHQEPEKVPISRPFTSDSTVLYAIDSSKAMRFATGKDLARQGLSEERLQAIAVANASRLKPVKISEERP